MSVMASSPFSPLGFLHFLEDENSSLFGKRLDRGQISRFMGHKMHHEEVDALLSVPVHIPLNASYNIEIAGYSRAQPEAFKSACLKYSYPSSNNK